MLVHHPWNTTWKYLFCGTHLYIFQIVWLIEINLKSLWKEAGNKTPNNKIDQKQRSSRDMECQDCRTLEQPGRQHSQRALRRMKAPQ